MIEHLTSVPLTGLVCVETHPHTQPLPLSPILDFSTDNFLVGLVAKDQSSSQAFLASPGRIAAPLQTQLATVAGLCPGGGEGASGIERCRSLDLKCIQFKWLGSARSHSFFLLDICVIVTS